MSQNRVGCVCCAPDNTTPCVATDGNDSDCPLDFEFELTIPAVTILQEWHTQGYPSLRCCTPAARPVVSTHTLTHGLGDCSSICRCHNCTWGMNPNGDDIIAQQPHYPDPDYMKVPFCAPEFPPTGDLSLDTPILPDWHPTKFQGNFYCADFHDDDCIDPAQNECSSTGLCTWNQIADCDICESGARVHFYIAAIGLAWKAEVYKCTDYVGDGNISYGICADYNGCPDHLPTTKWKVSVTIITILGEMQAWRNCNSNGYPYWGATIRTPQYHGSQEEGFCSDFRHMAGQQGNPTTSAKWEWDFDISFNPCNIVGKGDDSEGVSLVATPPSFYVPDDRSCTGREYYRGYYGNCLPFTPSWKIS